MSGLCRVINTVIASHSPVITCISLLTALPPALFSLITSREEVCRPAGTRSFSAKKKKKKKKITVIRCKLLRRRFLSPLKAESFVRADASAMSICVCGNLPAHMPPCASVRVSVRALRGGLSVSPAGWMPSPLTGVKSEACRLMTLSHHEGPQACSARKCMHETRTQKHTWCVQRTHAAHFFIFFLFPPHPSPSHLAGPKKHIGRTLKIVFLMSVTYVDQIHCNGMKSPKAIKSKKAKVEAAGGNTSSGCYLKLFTALRRLIGFFSLSDCYLQCKLISFQKQFFLPYHCNCACTIGTGTSPWPAFTLHCLHSLQRPALLLHLFLCLFVFFFTLTSLL